MYHRKALLKIGKSADHRNALLRNMVTSFFECGQVETTTGKAKAAQQVAERLITYAIDGSLANKRRIIQFLRDREVAHKLIKLGQENFAPRAKNTPGGGFTAIYKTGFRKGDGSEMAQLTLLLEPIPGKKHHTHAKKSPDVIEVEHK